MNFFLKPGDMICDLLKIEDPDARIGFRTFANIILWGIVVVAVALATI